MSARRLLHSAPRPCHSETELRNLFERHTKTLLDQKWRMIAEINEWGNNLVRQIEENLTKQKSLLEREYQNQVQHLRIKHREYLETALVYEDRKHREEVRQLLEQCHALQFSLVSFDYPERGIPFIQIQPVEKSTTIDHVFTSKDDQSVRTNPPPTLVLPTSMTSETCPACFIIFPPTMGTNERSQHVNQHFEGS